MTPYVARYLTAGDIEVFQRVKRLVEALPDDLDLGSNDHGEKVVLSCHILVRALAKVLGLKYADGYFYPNYRHSWLLTSGGQIIDAYPVAVWGGPFMMDGGAFSPALHLYKRWARKRAAHVSDHTFSRPWFRRAVRRVSIALERIPPSSL